MKVLFVCSGNSKNGITPIVKNQGESLIKHQDVSLQYYCIKGKGISGYLHNVKPLRQLIKDSNFDVIHAHYSLSAFASSLAGAKHLIVSLMGSDVKANRLHKFIIRLFNFIFHWKCIIVKSEDMKNSLGFSDAVVIPNGVDLDRFKPLDKAACQQTLNWNPDKKHILFAANPNRSEKNFPFAKQAVNSLNNPNLELHTLNNVNNEDMPIYYNAADVVILSSLWEGSPNVIKEAMACNRPIVSTDVGDVKFLLNSVTNCYISPFDVSIYASMINNIISHNATSSNGLDKLLSISLDSNNISNRLFNIYKSINLIS